MALQTYGPLLAADPTLRPIAGAAAVITHATTDQRYEPLDLDGNPTRLLSNRLGYLPQFQIEAPYGTPIMISIGGYRQYARPVGWIAIEGVTGDDEDKRARALAPVRAAMANAANAETRILVLGDSVSEGAIVPWTTTRDRWVSVLQQMLRTAYPVAGVPANPTGYNGVAGYVPAYYEWGDLTDMTRSGTVELKTDRGIGRRSVIIYPNSYVEISARLSSFRLHYSGDGGVWAVKPEVKVDGAVVSGVPLPPSSNSPTVWQSPAYTLGSHTVRITNAEPYQVLLLGVEVMEADEGKSVHVYDGSKSGHAVSLHDADDQVALHAALIKPDLTIIALGYNDLLVFNQDSVSYRRNLAQLIGSLREGGLTSPIVLLALPAIVGDYPATWLDYVEAMRVVAVEDQSTVVLDLTTQMPPTNVTSSGYYVTNEIHPTKAGHARIAELVAAAIKPAPVSTGGDAIGYDTDGVPYIAATGSGTGLAYDTDGVPYVTV